MAGCDCVKQEIYWQKCGCREMIWTRQSPGCPKKCPNAFLAFEMINKPLHCLGCRLKAEKTALRNPPYKPL
ncbi:hypothetical protein EJ06DRAFT_531025, partial [Trichodelitschia bisporula]